MTNIYKYIFVFIMQVLINVDIYHSRLRLYHSAVIYSYSPPPGNNGDLNSRPANPCYKPNHLFTLNCNVCLKYNFLAFAPHNGCKGRNTPMVPSPVLRVWGKWGGSGYKCVVYRVAKLLECENKFRTFQQCEKSSDTISGIILASLKMLQGRYKNRYTTRVDSDQAASL